MNRQFIIETIGWGLLVWVFGYVLAMILFTFVPVSLLGWIVTPIATVFTIWVLMKKIKSTIFMRYIIIAVVWTVIAVLFDYLFIVKAFHPEDGYYKPDVFLYYSLTFILPLIVGWIKSRKKAVAV